MNFLKRWLTFRITLGLVMLTTSLIFSAASMGLLPDQRLNIVRSRQQLCESLAMQFSAVAHQMNSEALHNYFEAVGARYEHVQTIGIRLADGTEMLQIGEHFANWRLPANEPSNDAEMRIPIFDNGKEWGAIEVQFVPLDELPDSGIASRPEFALVAFIWGVGFIVFYIYLRFSLRRLMPSKVMPDRVREALDALAEGLLVLDRNERIVLANRAFQETTGWTSEQLLGTLASDLPLVNCDDTDSEEHASPVTPWQATIAEGASVHGHLVAWDATKVTFSVGAAPILDEKGELRGALVSFENVTKLEGKKNELKKTLVKLNRSADEIRRQNRELERLATIDPLTGCNNRRSFFEKFDLVWNTAQPYERPLSACMIDIDHFKSVNDNFGHAVGDQVIQGVARTLQDALRRSDVVCRFGGEEFAVLLSDTTLEKAAEVAEKIRLAISQLDFPELSVTVSLGVASLDSSTRSAHELLERADKSLYVAKRSGRNQVVRWDQASQVETSLQNESSSSDSSIAPTPATSSAPSHIPFHAVTALISALAYRDQETANHSRRVADLCVAVADELLSMRDCYLLEIAGLLHDIGKIGVPDSILLKNTSLTDEEWQVMRQHERIGTELVRTSFGCDALNEIMGSYRIFYEESVKLEKTLPIGSRILAIVDAYDSMTTTQRYRTAMTSEEAVAELRQCAGTQFDPELVERVIQVLNVRGDEFTSQQDQVSKSAALNLGLQMEHLSASIDEYDVEGIRAIVSRLEALAIKHNTPSIAEKAKQISQAIQRKDELNEIILHTSELLDLCRSSQRTLVDTGLLA